ncbi:FliI/YscN family ATPase [Thalassobius sp. S69A]|uniref:FliI/YscN family ATPase n=1 Tax=unclassified Thalassovita TaxID=2619711 RepID=UPI000C119009|nr:flagellum-specific ATP synthase FliI [Paracoccaceae bacterium]MBT26118.1 flagellum-specific ATP synthase FliI [Paracoccaceae bacterium]
MLATDLSCLSAQIAAIAPVRRIGRVAGVSGGIIKVRGLTQCARIGDQLRLTRQNGDQIGGEVVRLEQDELVMLPDEPYDGVSLDDAVALCPPASIAPSQAWIGRVIDPFGRPLDGRPLLGGLQARSLQSAPPAPAKRRAMGGRLETGLAIMNTLLPIVKGQRIGLFAGSGVGKSSLLAHLARNMQADVVVIALIGERGRELRDFVEDTLGEQGMQRAVVVAATSDQSALARRRCGWTAMAVAEYFRDQGKQVLFLADSITRFAEAHREVAVAAGEAPSLRGFPPSTAHMIMSLCERAGPGEKGTGDITGIFSVLVAGSDMEEPIADILRGVLDGHVVLDRTIAERGRYPAIDLLRSVSRSLPNAATADENAMLSEARQLLGAYDQSEMMVRAGLYAAGNDETLDRAVAIWPELDAFIGLKETQGGDASFAKLQLLLRRSRSSVRAPLAQGAQPSRLQQGKGNRG